MKYAVDIDGILTRETLRGTILRTRDGQRPSAIISGRSFEEEAETKEYLASIGMDGIPLYLAPVKMLEKTWKTSAEHKANTLLSLTDVLEFWEDDARQAVYIHETWASLDGTRMLHHMPSPEDDLLQKSFATQEKFYAGDFLAELPIDRDFAYFTFNHPDAKNFGPRQDYQIVIPFSGGVDSFIAYHYAKQYFDKVQLVHLDYGHPYANTEKGAIEALGMKKATYFEDFSFMAEHQKKGEEYWGEIFPGRNWIVATFASRFIPDDGRGEIWLAAIGGEVKELWGDKSEYFFENASRLLTTNLRKTIRVKTPFKTMTKGQIIQWYLSHGGTAEEIKKTTSCHWITDYTQKQCGQCMGCAHRFVGMKYNGIDEEYAGDVKAYAKQIYGHELEDAMSKFGEQRLLEIRKAISD